jgi:DNA processing protein
MIAADGVPRGVRLDDAQRLAWLRLIRSENVGPVTFRELINHFGSAAAALDAVPQLAERGGRRIRIASVDEITREIAAAASLGARFVALGEPDYPPWLRHIDDAPPVIALRGNAGAVVRPCVGVVGSRNASVAGRKFAMQVARGLADAGFVVVSGLARGIDAAAHEATVDSGTVAVLAGGLDRIYPEENEPLALRILERGAHVSEMPMGLEPRGKEFPRRNRIISGMSLAIVVVEAALRSGSLITARRAADQGRLVFAVPGSPLDPRAEGTNRLIRDGAHIVTSVDDILTEVAPMLGQEPPQREVDEPAAEEPFASETGDRERALIVEALGPAPVAVDEIIRFTGLRPAIVHLVLLEMALAGRLERHPGGRVSLTGN